MAARRIDFARPPVMELPPVPAADPAVIEAAALLARAVAERERAEGALAAAQAALDEHRAAGADALLAALEAGEDGEDLGEAALVDRVAAAQRRVATASGAVALAAGRHDAALAQAKRTFRDQIEPLVREAVTAAANKAAAAAEANDALRALAQHAQDHGADLPGRPHELALPIPSSERLGELVAARHDLFAGPPAPPAGYVALRMLVDATPYAKGERFGLPAPDAVEWIKAGIAEPVDPADLARLGLTRLARFAEPQLIRLTRNYTPARGALVPAGTVDQFPPDIAARLVNLGLGEVVHG